MPKVHKVKARTDRYHRGARVEDPKVKKGYRIDKSKPADENDTLLCKKGETYYWWVFRYGGKRESKSYPKQSQLTQSDFLQRFYATQESFEHVDAEDLQMRIEEAVSELQELADEQREKKDNMPYQLQDGDIGMMLEERADGLDEIVSELESIDASGYEDLDEDDSKEEWLEEKIDEVNSAFESASF